MSRDNDKRIQEAIEIGEKNLRTMELVRNWCAHVTVKKTGGTGLIEAQTGLPIGHHALSCPHAPAGGFSTWDLEDAAVDFHDRNCHDCKVRKPVGLPNISGLVAERNAEKAKAAAQRRDADAQAAAALSSRDADRESVRINLDPGAASIIDLLADLDHGRGERVEERLLHAARLSPESFPRVPHFARDGDRVAGVFVQRVRVAERSFAVLFHERSATLVPWRAEMDRAATQLMAGRVNGRSFDFKVGREAEKALKAMTPWLGR